MSIPAFHEARTGRPGKAASRASAAADAAALRKLIQRFVRTFGLLAADRTPCGKPLPLSHAHALMALAEHARAHRRVTQQELGQVLGIDKSNVARLCAKLAQAGHVKQERTPLDGRARLLSLTSAGVRVARSVEHSSHQRFQRIIEALGTDGRQGVLSALELLNGAVGSVVKPTARVIRPRPGGTS